MSDAEMAVLVERIAEAVARRLERSRLMAPAALAAVTVLTCAAAVLAWPLAELIEVAIE